MASAAAPRLGTRTRYALALAIFVATALLAVLNPWLAIFAVAGFALGWVMRNLPLIAGVAAGIGVSPKRLAGGLAIIATVAGTGLTAWQVLDPGVEAGPPPSPIQQFVPVSYSARATLEREREAFVLRERLIVPPESLRLVRDEAAPEKPEEFLARQLARAGWADPRLVGEALEVSRVGRKSEAAHFGRMTRRATLALPIPEDLSSGEAALVATAVTVVVVAPKHWVLATAPPSESEPLPGDLEQRRVREEVDVGTMHVELAGPLFRNELGASLLGLSVSGAVKWGVLLVFGVFADELKKIVGGILGKLRPRRRGSTPAPTPPPPAQ